MSLGLSFRARVVTVVLAVAVAPVVLTGVWLAGGAARSGERLLVSRLEGSLDAATAEIGARWVGIRALLLDVAEHPDLQALAGGSDQGGETGDVDARVARVLERGVEHLRLENVDGTAVWWRGDEDQDPEAVVRARLPVLDGARRVGTLEATMPLRLLLEADARDRAAAGAVLVPVDPVSGRALLSVPFDLPAPEVESFTWGGERWLARRRTLPEPALELAAASSLAPFTTPFQEAARRGAWVLLVTAALGIALSTAITGRMSRANERLMGAADAVSRGDFSPRLPEHGSDEVARVGRAFNTMATSLTTTLGELSRRESLAAVGAFAAELAHEVRNPLTSVRMDLQIVEERTDDAELRTLLADAVEEIDRLQRTLSATLQLARGARSPHVLLDLADPLEAAARSAEAAFQRVGASLEVGSGTSPLHVLGDADALTQLFLNLLLNAAEALPEGGRATVSARIEGDEAVVEIADDGPGIDAARMETVFQPFVTDKPTGTGLGLPTARRIATAHGGRVELFSQAAKGTAAVVRVPLAHGSTLGT